MQTIGGIALLVGLILGVKTAFGEEIKKGVNKNKTEWQMGFLIIVARLRKEGWRDFA